MRDMWALIFVLVVFSPIDSDASHFIRRGGKHVLDHALRPALSISERRVGSTLGRAMTGAWTETAPVVHHGFSRFSSPFGSPIGSPFSFHSSRAFSTLPKKYEPLTTSKLEAYDLDPANFKLVKGRARVSVGMILEGTAAYDGVLPDIMVDEEAVRLLREKYIALSCTLEKPSVETTIDCAERVVRELIPNNHPDSIHKFTLLNEAISENSYVPLSKFIEHGIGDCRPNALSLAIVLGWLEKDGLISGVEYTNRKWGTLIRDGKPEDEVGQHGDHACCTFRYKDSPVRYIADAYAVEYDRVPVDGASGVARHHDWYNALFARKTGAEHNVWEQMVRDGTFWKLRESMDQKSRKRFLLQARELRSEDGKYPYAYLSRALEYPRAFVPKDQDVEPY